MITCLGLGSNLGDKELNISTAIDLISRAAGKVLAVSSMHISEPWGFESQNSFVNAAILIDTDLKPMELLKALQHIEKKMGRLQKSTDEVYADRVIDIDILTYGDMEIDLPDLKIPHPHMRARDFVMKPFRELPGND